MFEQCFLCIIAAMQTSKSPNLPADAEFIELLRQINPADREDVLNDLRAIAARCSATETGDI